MQERKCEKEKRSRTIAERICESLDITPDVLPGGYKIEIHGRNGIKVSGCGRILLYAPCEIRVELSGTVLAIVGRDLVCVAYSSGSVEIEGKINDVLFKDRI